MKITAIIWTTFLQMTIRRQGKTNHVEMVLSWRSQRKKDSVETFFYSLKLHNFEHFIMKITAAIWATFLQWKQWSQLRNQGKTTRVEMVTIKNKLIFCSLKRHNFKHFIMKITAAIRATFLQTTTMISAKEPRKKNLQKWPQGNELSRKREEAEKNLSIFLLFCSFSFLGMFTRE